MFFCLLLWVVKVVDVEGKLSNFNPFSQVWLLCVLKLADLENNVYISHIWMFLVLPVPV